MPVNSALVADDYTNMRLLLTTMLRQLGFEKIDEAHHGEAAVAAFDRGRQSIIFLDINMPRKTGLEALKEIIALDPKAYVIMQTGEREAVAIKSAIEAGAKGYVVKPYNFTSIKENIDRFQKWQQTQG